MVDLAQWSTTPRACRCSCAISLPTPRSGRTRAGAVFAASNAALMLAQLGDEDGAVKEVRRGAGGDTLCLALCTLR